ncbi:MAG: putative hydrolase of HD superfamily [Paracoccaceae bacterium]
MNLRLEQQFSFLNAADRLKKILRATPVLFGARPENSGEHSWHVALYAMVLADQAGPSVTISRVIQMLLIHDIVEIDAGDAPIHGNHDPILQAKIESKAADRLFGILPADQAQNFRALWDEFEAAQSADAIFAKSLDRVQPVMQNIAAGGGSWIDYNVTFDQLEDRVGTKVARGAPQIWNYVRVRAQAFFSK